MICTVKNYGGGRGRGRDKKTCSKSRRRESIKVPGRDDDACLPHHKVEVFLMDKYQEYSLTSMPRMRLI